MYSKSYLVWRVRLINVGFTYNLRFILNRHTLEKPMRFRTDLRFVVSPLIESGCPNFGTSFTFEYQLHSVQKEMLHPFPLQTTKDLIVEPYQLNIFSKEELLVVFLKVTEVIVETGHKESVEVSVRDTLLNCC